MMLAMGALMSSKCGLPHWSGNWPNSLDPETNLAGAMPLQLALPENLAAALESFDGLTVGLALDRAVIAAAGEFADGIAAYRSHPYRRADDGIRAVWRSGGTALLDHGVPGQAAGDVPVLFVPSLVNRGWVLDLVPGEGMLSWLALRGIHPYRIEWGPPGIEERDFDVTDYVVRRLEPALDEVRRRTGRPPILTGYCMGGLLALAAAVRRPDAISGLALLATPWDFHAEGAERARAIADLYARARAFITSWGEFPIDMIQGLFAAHDPIVALRKFRKFSSMDPNSVEARNFVALEDWLNEGVALTLPVADEAFQNWYGANLTGLGRWSVCGRMVDPAVLSGVPALIVVPAGDKLVPPRSAAAVLDRLPDAERLDLPLGHIGMVVGRQAEASLWQPLSDWLAATGAAAS
jgi:polyhydroxyalkanoate synthase